MAQTKVITLEELAKHNKDGDCWVAVDGKVYNVSVFAALHPGGRQIIMQYAGKDASDVFHVYHNPSVLQKYHAKFYIGDLQKTPEQLATEKKRQKALSKYPNAFGDMVPYGDPLWYQRFNSPYYKATHVQWRAKVRAFVEAHIMPTMAQWQDKSDPPRDLVLKMGEEGLLAAMCGTPPPREFLPAHIAKKIPEDFDNFHELILFDEIARCGHAGVVGALTNGPAIALTVVLRFGSDEMKQRVVPEVILGRKYIALAISEPQAGSDVAGTTAVAKREGDVYIANGNKKWITNGTYADYFATAFRTGKRGQLSFFLVERGLPGFSTRKLNIRDSAISGTAYLDFDNCKIPAKNLIGPENEGFKLIMFNFNHERVYIIILALRMSRICVEECIKYALRRKAFGKPLSELQSIRMKISSMARQIEAQQAWLESIVYQLNTMSHLEANEKLGDVIAMCKAQASIIFEHCAEEATNIFGGNALYMDGVGKRIEGSVIQVKGYKIPAGSQDVMEDFAGKMAFRQAARLAKL